MEVIPTRGVSPVLLLWLSLLILANKVNTENTVFVQIVLREIWTYSELLLNLCFSL